MNKEEIENYKKEYENMSLCDLADELVEPLFTVKKELAKTIYIHYAEERDKNYKLQQENKKYKIVIEKAIEYLETKRIREKAIIDIDVLEGILKEVE